MQFYYGDTNSCMSVISAKRKKFQFSIWKLQPLLRRESLKLTEKLLTPKDINLPLTERRNYLVREGLPPETIIKTGSHKSFRFSQNSI